MADNEERQAHRISGQLTALLVRSQATAMAVQHLAVALEHRLPGLLAEALAVARSTTHQIERDPEAGPILHEAAPMAEEDLRALLPDEGRRGPRPTH